MSASTSTPQLIKLRIIAATSDIEETTTQMIDNLSKDFELLERSKVYPSRGNPNEARVYLTFRRKNIIDNDGAAQPLPLPQPGKFDVVKGGGGGNTN